MPINLPIGFTRRVHRNIQFASCFKMADDFNPDHRFYRLTIPPAQIDCPVRVRKNVQLVNRPGENTARISENMIVW